MPWKRGNPGCPCCVTVPPTCDCPRGGVSRKFLGTPVLIVTVEGLPATYEWTTVNRYVFNIGVERGIFWESYTLSGLDTLNGTYAWELEKNELGCIPHPINIVDSVEFGPGIFTPAFPFVHVERRLAGTTGCTVTNTVTNSVTLAANFQASRSAGNPSSPSAGTFVVSLSMSYRYVLDDGNHFALNGRRVLRCDNDYDPSLETGQSTVGAFPGSMTTSARPNSSSEIWITRKNSLRDQCITPYTFDYDVLGHLHAEIVDDVP